MAFIIILAEEVTTVEAWIATGIEEVMIEVVTTEEVKMVEEEADMMEASEVVTEHH